MTEGKKSYQPVPKLGAKPKGQHRGRARPDTPIDVWCAARLPDICEGRADCRHHRTRRSQGGTDDPANTVDLCSPCHVHIHANPAWSYRHGWLHHALPAHKNPRAT